MAPIFLADDSLDYRTPLLTIVARSLYITLAICVIGVIIVAAKIVIGYLDGSPQREAFGLFWVIGACLLAASATGIVSALI